MKFLNMTIHRNSLRLAGVYLTILMIISLFFSINVYQLSVQELDRGLRRPGPNSAINRLPADSLGRNTLNSFLAEQEAQYDAAQQRILQRLIVVNLIILAWGGVLSYYFAARTLRPIEEAHEAQSRFTADASHELRTPLAAMRAENEVALMDPKLTVKKAKQVLESNVEELAKLTELSAGLLRLAQVEKSGLAKKRVTIDTVIQPAIDRVIPLAEKKNILIHGTVEQGKLLVNADSASLVEAFVIILDNAVKYSPSKTEVTVTIETVNRDIVVRIADQGIGIKATELQHIFERFYRADSSRSKQEVTGYGLGLAIAKQIVQLHGGKLSVTSQPAKGSVFSVTLPLAKQG